MNSLGCVNGNAEWAEYDYDIYDEEEWQSSEDEWAWAENDWDENSNVAGPSDPTARRGSNCRRASLQRMRMQLAAQVIVDLHNDLYMSKEPCRTSALPGADWLAELTVGHPKRMYESFRMSKANFFGLCELLENRYGLATAENVFVQEQVAIFLWIVGQRANTRNACERFQHSGETIHRHFHNVLQSLKSMAIEWVRPHPWPRETIHPKIRNSERYFPAFENAIGAIDGTHIKANPPPGEIAKWIGRKGYPTQNIMAAVDFDMCFTFALAGWEGSAHDTRIFYQTLRNRRRCFPHPRDGEYYLVDDGYPNIPGYLAPYKGCTYHMPQWRAGARPRSNFEKFNKLHSSLRCTVERTFGVWKARWPLICDIPKGYSMETQTSLVIATMAVHNFIRRRNMPDIPFNFYDRREHFMPSDRGVETTASNGQHGAQLERDDEGMDRVREKIRDYIVEHRIRC